MRLFPGARASWACTKLFPTVATLVLALAWSGTAAAQGDAPGASSNAEEAEEQAIGGAAGTKAAAAPPAAEKLTFVEHLPGSAFPDPPRGLYGGSLWLNTFHGLQWPYMPRTGLGISGYAWVDTGYEQIKSPEADHDDAVKWIQQGRAVLRFTPTYSDGHFFVQGQGELVANKDQSVVQPNVVDTDDLWVRLGVWKKWDVQAGRFEAWEVYHLGMGLDQNTLERIGPVDSRVGAPFDFYGVTNAFYRAAGLGNVAAHVYPWSWLRVEALGQAGNQNGQNAIGGRGAAILDFGIVKVKGAAEYRHTTQVLTLNQTINGVQSKTSSPERTNAWGYGGSVQVLLNPFVEFGVNLAQELTDQWDMSGAPNGFGTFTINSMGGFANARVIPDLLVGAGVNYSKKDDTHTDNLGKNDSYTNLQSFGAVQYLISKQLFVKAVFAYAKATWDPSFDNGPDIKFSDVMLSGRLRLLYLF